jgi:uncharacterized membrane protein
MPWSLWRDSPWFCSWRLADDGAIVRLFGHPVHLMLVHFPVALWPAHWTLHLLADRLPPGIASIAGFWLLAAGTGIGWLAATCGASDLAAIAGREDSRLLKSALIHAAVNGTLLLAFTVLLGMEIVRYPEISHDGIYLLVEGGLLGVLAVGNYLGGRIDWRRAG